MTISGTKDLRKREVIAGPRPDGSQLRCGSCKGIAVQVPDGKGGVVFRCTGCGTKYTSSRI
jgi:hypothetical protein